MTPCWNGRRRKDLGYRELLTQALTCGWQDRKRKGAEARLPWIKIREQFDFTFQPSIDRKVVRRVERAENVVLLGPPRVGKSHLAIGFAIKAAKTGHRVLFLTLEELMGKLKRASQEDRLERQLQQLMYSKVLILSATCRCLGRTPVCCSVWWRGVTRRPLILTSNKSFVDRGNIFSDAVPATAILDRSLHHSMTINIKGESYRLKSKRKAGMLSALVKEEDSKAASG